MRNRRFMGVGGAAGMIYLGWREDSGAPVFSVK
jgi:hypothetical protein